MHVTWYARNKVIIAVSAQYRAYLVNQDEIEQNNNFWLRKLKTSIFANARYNRKEVKGIIINNSSGYDESTVWIKINNARLLTE